MELESIYDRYFDSFKHCVVILCTRGFYEYGERVEGRKHSIDKIVDIDLTFMAFPNAFILLQKSINQRVGIGKYYVLRELRETGHLDT